MGHGAGFLHCSDIGGMVPASISPRASEIFQEGLRLPPKKLFVRGEPNRDLLDVILANCRIPEQNWGDLQALVAGLVTGERRVHALIGRFGVDTVLKGMDDLIDYTARKVEALIRRMPPRPLPVLRLHRGRRGVGHPDPSQRRDDGGRRRDPPGLHGQRRAGGLRPQRPDRGPRASVHGDRAVQLLHHQGSGHPAERGRAAADPDDAAGRVGGEPAVPRGVRRPLRHRAAHLRRGAGRAGPRAARGDPGRERRAGLHGRPRAPGSRGGAAPRDRDRADDRRRRRAPRARRDRRLRRLARLPQDDPGGDPRGRGARHPDPPLPPRRRLRRARALARRARGAARHAGVPARGTGHRAGDGAAPLRPLGRGGRPRGRHRPGRAQPRARRASARCPRSICSRWSRATC